MLISVILVAIIGIAAAFYLGLIVGAGRKFDHAKAEAIVRASNTCPVCCAPVRGKHGRFVKSSQHVENTIPPMEQL